MTSNKSSKKSAPTKIILIGEHAVVHGIPAMSLPVDLITKIKITQSDKFNVSSNKLLHNDVKTKLKSQVGIVLNSLKIKGEPKIHITINVSVPPGIGFGVSASIAVALTKALYAFYETELPEKKLFEIAEALEKENHGNPSGIDHTTIILNEPLLFQRSVASSQSLEFRCKKIPEIWSKDIFKNFFLINTGKPKEATKEMVDLVSERLKKFPDETKDLFQKIKQLTPTVISALRDNDTNAFCENMNEAGLILQQLGVVSESVKELSAMIRKRGGMAKISGAGGRTGGSGILLVWHQDTGFVKDICEEHRLEYWKIQ